MATVEGQGTYQLGVESSSGLFEPVTPSDSTDLDHTTRAVIIANGGDLEVNRANDGTTVVVSLPAGWHALRVTRILDGSTTATGITAVY